MAGSQEAGMKLLETATSKVKQAAAAVAGALQPAQQRTRDPWYSDDERKAAVNAGSYRGGPRWIPRRIVGTAGTVG